MLDLLFRNWHLKLLALLLAFAVWVAVTGDNRVLQVYSAPLDIKLPEDCVLAGPVPTKVNVSLRGPESLIRRLDPLKLSFRVDVTDAPPGQRNVQLAAESLVGLPRGVEVVQIDPDRLRLTVDRRMRKVLPVAPSLVGAPPPGYSFYGAHVTPDTLEVEGPQTEVVALDRVRTDPIHLEGRTSSFTVAVNAVPDRPATRLLDPREVSVQIEVDVVPIKAAFDGVPVVFANQEYEATAHPSAVRVLISGPPGVIHEVGPAQIRPVAELTGLTPRPEPYTARLRIEFAGIAGSDLARITVVSVSRPEIAIRIWNRRIAR
jgi:YbbR domain-containing protein